MKSRVDSYVLYNPNTMHEFGRGTWRDMVALSRGRRAQSGAVIRHADMVAKERAQFDALAKRQQMADAAPALRAALVEVESLLGNNLTAISDLLDLHIRQKDPRALAAIRDLDAAWRLAAKAMKAGE